MAQRIKRFGQISGPGIYDPQQLSIEATNRRHAAQLAYQRDKDRMDMAMLMERLFAQQQAAEADREYRSGEAELARQADRDAAAERFRVQKLLADKSLEGQKDLAGYTYKLSAEERKRKADLEERRAVAAEDAVAATRAETARREGEAADKRAKELEDYNSPHKKALRKLALGKATADTKSAQLKLKAAEEERKKAAETERQLKVHGLDKVSTLLRERSIEDEERKYTRSERDANKAARVTGPSLMAYQSLDNSLTEALGDEAVMQLVTGQRALEPHEHKKIVAALYKANRLIRASASQLSQDESAEALEAWESLAKPLMNDLHGKKPMSAEERQEANRTKARYAGAATAGGILGFLLGGGPVGAAAGAAVTTGLNVAADYGQDIYSGVKDFFWPSEPATLDRLEDVFRSQQAGTGGR